ncbi:uncharacterized protein [Medicago truncatula]|uniref:uncharacterized protein isoform X2 n=1 Tax=Medicago truncatula TaxID=3880 RepID=UPI00196818D5|nr:uncharacterized protein LOC120576933 isoform X2 [Medicago truncatula]
MDAKTLCISNFMLVNLNMRSSYLGECFEMELSTPNLCTFEFGVTPLPKLCGSKSNLSSIKHAYIDVSMLVNDADTPLILPSWLLELANIKWLTITSRTLEKKQGGRYKSKRNLRCRSIAKRLESRESSKHRFHKPTLFP